METRTTRIALRAWAVLVVGFLHLPIVIVILYAFNAQTAQGWPITDWTTKWFGPALHDEEMQQALLLSLKAAFAATAIALVLGAAAAFAVHRSQSAPREFRHARGTGPGRTHPGAAPRRGVGGHEIRRREQDR